MLRYATPADIPLLEDWDRRPHVAVNAGDDGDMEWRTEIPRCVDWREILIAEADGQPIGVIVIIDPAQEETHYWGDIEADLRAIDIWIGEEAYLNQGYGTAMMREAIERCFAPPEVHAILVDPFVGNHRVHPFYEKFGFCRIERRMFGPDDCYVYRLERQRWDVLAVR